MGALVMMLVHASPSTLAPYRRASLGVLSSPRRYYTNVDGWRWAADNDAYSDWNEVRYRRMLEAIYGLPGCLFVTAPDVVGNGAATLALFEHWYEELNAVWQPLALVAQDGMQRDEIPWARIDALFIGGTSEFKLGPEARELAREARLRDKWLHMGRVNSHRRVRYAKALRCDSVDGTQLSWFRDAKLPQFLEHAEAPPQLLLDD